MGTARRKYIRVIEEMALAPCPFHPPVEGRGPYLAENGDAVRCSVCGATGPRDRKLSDATLIQGWNQRWSEKQ